MYVCKQLAGMRKRFTAMWYKSHPILHIPQISAPKHVTFTGIWLHYLCANYLVRRTEGQEEQMLDVLQQIFIDLLHLLDKCALS